MGGRTVSLNGVLVALLNVIPRLIKPQVESLMEEGMERPMGYYGLLEGIIDGLVKDSSMMQVKICGMVDGNVV